MVSPQEISDIHPYIDVDDIAGGVYAYSDDGSVDPTGNNHTLLRKKSICYEILFSFSRPDKCLCSWSKDAWCKNYRRLSNRYNFGWRTKGPIRFWGSDQAWQGNFSQLTSRWNWFIFSLGGHKQLNVREGRGGRYSKENYCCNLSFEKYCSLPFLPATLSSLSQTLDFWLWVCRRRTYFYCLGPPSPSPLHNPPALSSLVCSSKADKFFFDSPTIKA